MEDQPLHESSGASDLSFTLPPSDMPWHQGFFTILIAPYQLGRSYFQPRVYPIMVGILLNVLLSILTSYVMTSNPDILNEVFQQAKRSIEAVTNYLPEEQVEEMIDQTWERLSTFSLTSATFQGVVSGVLGIFLPAVVFWILYRLTTAEMPPFLLIANFVGFAQSIIFIGGILNAITMYFAGSLRYGTSLLLFTSDITRLSPLTFSLLNQVELFSIWSYIAAGVATSGLLGYSRGRGIVYGVIVYALKLLVIAIPALLVQMFRQMVS